MRALNCVVTGGSSGVGRGMARALARAGARVTIVSRDAARGAAAAEALRRETGNTSVDHLSADLSSLSAVRSLADAIRAKHNTLHVLSNNAAILTPKRVLTPDGLESVFAVGYLSHFLLTHLVSDALKAGAPSRVITVVGQPGLVARLQPRFDDLSGEGGFSPFRATMRVAVAKTLFTMELARRLSGSGVTVNAFHPGLVRSRLSSGLQWYFRVPLQLASLFFRGESATGAYLALAPEVEGVTGGFFLGRKAAPFLPRYDVDAASRDLWRLSARLCGIAEG